jgi:hypothetical protein
VEAIRFEDPDPREIRIGMQRLDVHLREMGLRDALVLREILSEQDWSAFEAQYSPVGRRGYAPWLMALFGLMRGISSLRGLERLTRSDLECMWVCSPRTIRFWGGSSRAMRRRVAHCSLR